MIRQRYPEEFKIEVVKLVIVKGKSVADVACAWVCSFTVSTLGSSSTTRTKISVNKAMTGKPSCVSFVLNPSA